MFFGFSETQIDPVHYSKSFGKMRTDGKIFWNFYATKSKKNNKKYLNVFFCYYKLLFIVSNYIEKPDNGLGQKMDE